jgi:hypothetical protein
MIAFLPVLHQVQNHVDFVPDEGQSRRLSCWLCTWWRTVKKAIMLHQVQSQHDSLLYCPSSGTHKVNMIAFLIVLHQVQSQHDSLLDCPSSGTKSTW